jgi:hypothetical protein
VRLAEQIKAKQSRTEQNRAEQSRTEQNRAEQSRTEQNRAEQSRAERLHHIKDKIEGRADTKEDRAEHENGVCSYLQMKGEWSAAR